jgi:hypothetical protein
MGISTLKQPTKTLFRNLEFHQRALQKEKVFAEWIIEQVPAILILLNEKGNVTYANDLVQQLDVSRVLALMYTALLPTILPSLF